MGLSALDGLGSYTIRATDKAGNDAEATFLVTERNAVISGSDKSITYEAGKTYDLSGLFTVEDGVAIARYEIVANADEDADAGTGTIEGAQLTVTAPEKKRVCW